MKVRSGLKDIYQNNLHPITKQSLRTFLHMAQVHLCDPTLSHNEPATDNNDEIDDVYVLGILKLQSIIRDENCKKVPSRFIWALMHANNNINDSLTPPDLTDAEE